MFEKLIDGEQVLTVDKDLLLWSNVIEPFMFGTTCLQPIRLCSTSLSLTVKECSTSSSRSKWFVTKRPSVIRAYTCKTQFE